ncbi:hypothetical protein BDQ12DRAFT_738775 [Crucibulum laeve]|uniref:DUF6534 domain-containing protein n=1 Tax=Crucibulum laeve TaxID=68775 RepID=A0A5C3LJU2_9AGAR|nr:hypothetical protein BDQ12DRAFT_738775 [Crucibulum laeve]
MTAATDALGLNLNSTLGAVFLGNIAAAILYGITTLQTFTYYKTYQRDSLTFRWLVLGHYPYGLHDAWGLLLSRYRFYKPFGSFETYLESFVSGRNNLLVLAIIIASIYVFASGFAFACQGFIAGSYTNMIQQSWMLYSGLGTAVFADGLVAVSLCILLQRSRTGIKSTDSLLNVLMLYSINTGLLTSICATACFITFAIWPHEFIYMGIYFTLSKLFVNNLLAGLNSRASLRRRNSGMSTIPLSPSSVQTLSVGFLADPEPPIVSKPQPIRFSTQDRI